MRDNHLKYKYQSVKLSNILFCILLPGLLIASFLLEGEPYFKIGLSFVIILNWISFIVLRRRIEKMRYFLIATEIITIGMIAIPFVLDFNLMILLILLIVSVGSLQNISHIWDKQFFNYSIDVVAGRKSEEAEITP